MVTQEFMDRDHRDIETHPHEGWQLQGSARGGWYCTACGRAVSDDEARQLGAATVDNHG